MTRKYEENTRKFEPPRHPLHSPGSASIRPPPAPLKCLIGGFSITRLQIPLKDLIGKGARGRSWMNGLRRLSGDNYN